MDLPEKKIETVGICRNKNAASTILPNENWDLDQFTYRFAMIYYLHVWINWLLKGRWNGFIDLGFLDGQQELGAWDYISHASNTKKTLSVIPNLCKSSTKLTKAWFPGVFKAWECNTSTWNGGLAMQLISKVGRGGKHGEHEMIGLRHASKRNPWLWLSQECVSSQLSKPNYLPKKNLSVIYPPENYKTSMWKSHHFYVDHTLRTGGKLFPWLF